MKTMILLLIGLALVGCEENASGSVDGSPLAGTYYSEWYDSGSGVQHIQRITIDSDLNYSVKTLVFDETYYPDGIAGTASGQLVLDGDLYAFEHATGSCDVALEDIPEPLPIDETDYGILVDDTDFVVAEHQAEVGSLPSTITHDDIDAFEASNAFCDARWRIYP